MRETWRPWAITGGIAEGKSTILGYLSNAGFSVVSADAVARDIYARADVQEQIRAVFGTTDRDAVRARLSDDPSARRELNRLMHELVWRALEHTRADVVEVPLLVEAALQIRCRGVWVVTCGEEEQRARLVARVGSTELAERLLATQLPTRVKEVFADRVLRTNLPEAQVRREVLEAAKQDFRR